MIKKAREAQMRKVLGDGLRGKEADILDMMRIFTLKLRNHLQTIF